MSNLIPQQLNVTQEQLDNLFVLAGRDMSLSITGAWNGLTEITVWYRAESERAMKVKVCEILKEGN